MRARGLMRSLALAAVAIVTMGPVLAQDGPAHDTLTEALPGVWELDPRDPRWSPGTSLACHRNPLHVRIGDDGRYVSQVRGSSVVFESVLQPAPRLADGRPAAALAYSVNGRTAAQWIVALDDENHYTEFSPHGGAGTRYRRCTVLEIS